ncbi:hypothetical protein ASF71_21550 [Deinococcus sp. Leaf326]|nr:hypothetical protein ASF71_21550 [Deinococcus sp. Leaf326]
MAWEGVMVRATADATGEPPKVVTARKAVVPRLSATGTASSVTFLRSRATGVFCWSALRTRKVAVTRNGEQRDVLAVPRDGGVLLVGVADAEGGGDIPRSPSAPRARVEDTDAQGIELEAVGLVRQC